MAGFYGFEMILSGHQYNKKEGGMEGGEEEGVRVGITP